MNTIIVDYRSNERELFHLNEMGLNIIKTPRCPNLYEAIDGHPDIQIFVPKQGKAIVHKSSSSSLFEQLAKHNIEVTPSHNTLGLKYPHNIFLNCVLLGDYFIHNIKYTDESIIPYINEKIFLNVKQGYTKCSTAILSKKAIITSDTSIKKALAPYNIDVLFVPPGGIELPGLNYGFIGGTCGLIDSGEIAFFGNLSKYKYGTEVIEFLIKHDVRPTYLSDSNLIDRGSILMV